MKNELFESTRMLAYLLWEYSKCENALGLWYCAEDLANYFERNDIITFEALDGILDKEKKDYLYISFVRNIAYRLYLYTGERNQNHNWYLAEEILNNGEFRLYIVTAASIFNKIKKEDDMVKSIRSELVRSYYKNLEFTK